MAAVTHLREAGWLKTVEWFDEIDSTNSHARRLATSSDLPLPALFVADRQSAGRGRVVRTWWSPAGCLMFSLVIDQSHMPLQPATWPRLGLIAGVAVAKAIEAEAPGLPIKLKWPNDIYLNESKLAGILIESTPCTTAGQTAFIVGIGVNVAVDFKDAPIDVQSRACSLNQFTSQPAELESILIEIIESLQRELHDWQQGNEGWWTHWNARSLLTDRTIHLRTASSAAPLTGICQGIDAAGHLLLHDGLQQHHIQSAEIIQWQ